MNNTIKLIFTLSLAVILTFSGCGAVTDDAGKDDKPIKKSENFSDKENTHDDEVTTTVIDNNILLFDSEAQTNENDNENGNKSSDSQKDSQFQINGISFEEENVEIHLTDDNDEGYVRMCPTLDISGGGAWDGIDIKWSSDDGCVQFESEITSYGEDCVMYCNTPGSHVITATTPNGMTANCTITVYGAESVNNNYLDVEEVNTSIGDIFKVTWYLSDDHSTRAIAGTRFDTEGIIIAYDYTNDNIDGYYKMEYSFLAKNSGEVTIYFDEGSGYPLSCKVYISNPAGDIGDINGDGEINLSDVLALKRHMAVESGQSTNEEWRLTDDQIVRADVYMDGGITDYDVLKLRRYIAAQSNDDTARKYPGWLKLGTITDDDLSGEDVDVDVEM